MCGPDLCGALLPPSSTKRRFLRYNELDRTLRKVVRAGRPQARANKCIADFHPGVCPNDIRAHECSIDGCLLPIVFFFAKGRCDGGAHDRMRCLIGHGPTECGRHVRCVAAEDDPALWATAPLPRWGGPGAAPTGDDGGGDGRPPPAPPPRLVAQAGCGGAWLLRADNATVALLRGLARAFASGRAGAGVGAPPRALARARRRSAAVPFWCRDGVRFGRADAADCGGGPCPPCAGREDAGGAPPPGRPSSPPQPDFHVDGPAAALCDRLRADAGLARGAVRLGMTPVRRARKKVDWAAWEARAAGGRLGCNAPPPPPPGAAAAAAGAESTTTTTTVVVAWCNQPIDWLAKIPCGGARGLDMHVYQKEGGDCAAAAANASAAAARLPRCATLHRMPNRGTEPEAYLTYLLDHYDTLPDKVVFLQDEESELFLPVERLLDYVRPWRFVALSGVVRKWWGKPPGFNVETTPTDRWLVRWFPAFVRETLRPQRKWTAAWRGMFAVDRATLRLQPRDAYAAALAMHRSLWNTNIGHVLEVLWSTLFFNCTRANAAHAHSSAGYRWQYPKRGDGELCCA